MQEKEIKQLERTVTGYFDYIEGLIERENTFTMEQLAKSVNKFLDFNDYKFWTEEEKFLKYKLIKKQLQLMKFLIKPKK